MLGSMNTPTNLPAHRSFSQLGTYRKCQHLYYLTRILGIKEDPSCWLVAGTSIHEMIEKVNHEFVAAAVATE